jgi:hypothetical protein
MNVFHVRSILVLALAACSAESLETGELQGTLVSQTLPSGGVILPGESVVTPDGQIHLVYQYDGNLVLSNNAGPVWHSNTWGTEPGRVVMQEDGNFVVYDAWGTPRWWSNSFRRGSYLRLGVDNYDVFAVVCAGTEVHWSSLVGGGSCSGTSTPGTPPGGGTSGPPPNTLLSGDRLLPNQSRETLDGRFRMTYQPDGNFVLYEGGTALWSSNTSGTSAGYVAMQRDGNLVVYDASETPVWSSNTFWIGSTARVVPNLDGEGRLLSGGSITICDAGGTGRAWGTNTNQNGCTLRPTGGGGTVPRPCSSVCSGCMPHSVCLQQLNLPWESCEATGFEGSDGSCYQRRELPENCNQYGPFEQRCSDCDVFCRGTCSSIPELCSCNRTGRRDREYECCTRRLDPSCPPP